MQDIGYRRIPGPPGRSGRNTATATGLALALGALVMAGPAAAQSDHGGEAHEPGDSIGWRMPPMPASMPMLPGMNITPAELAPPVTPFLPAAGTDPATLPEAIPGSVERLADGDTIELTAMRVRRTIRGKTLVMYGFNGQYPGPLIEVDEDATIIVEFRNEIDLPSTIHWHGVRLDNRFDGVPEVTQDPVPPGSSFTYRVHLPDAGIYWYHPHVRSDIQQDLGLYGNLMVRAPDPDYFNPVNREEVLILDDLLLDERGVFPYGRESAIHTLMGRFGNVFLVNGEPSYDLEVPRGSVVRFSLTNVSNTRTFNLTVGGAALKLVGADIGRFEREERINSVVIAPAQRYIVEARFEEAGTYALANRIQAIDHFRGEFYPRTDTLGTIRVTGSVASEDHGAAFEHLRANPEVSAEIEPYRKHFDRPIDHHLVLSTRAGNLPRTTAQVMSADTLFRPPVGFNDMMPMMNYLSSGGTVRWILRDGATGREGTEIGWRFRVGDVVKIRNYNDPESFHPMQHPIHIHGQRFLVLARDGVPNDNLVWKDTVLVPVGSRVDILLELSNPGDWLAHCHISEHIEAGMTTVITVEPAVGSDG